jgi:hypothetical protein
MASVGTRQCRPSDAGGYCQHLDAEIRNLTLVQRLPGNVLGPVRLHHPRHRCGSPRRSAVIVEGDFLRE